MPNPILTVILFFFLGTIIIPKIKFNNKSDEKEKSKTRKRFKNILQENSAHTCQKSWKHQNNVTLIRFTTKWMFRRTIIKLINFILKYDFKRLF